MWSLYGELSQADPASHSDVQRRLLAIMDLRQEVNAGGFDSYFREWGGNSAPVALAALPRALGQQWAALLRQAMHVVGAPYPEEDPDQRANRLDANPAADRALHELDEHFYALEAAEDADDRLTEFVASW